MGTTQGLFLPSFVKIGSIVRDITFFHKQQKQTEKKLVMCLTTPNHLSHWVKSEQIMGSISECSTVIMVAILDVKRTKRIYVYYIMGILHQMTYSAKFGSN